MVSEIKLEFPEFITHIDTSKNKSIKIGYNKIYASSHFTVRAAFVAALHGYLEKHIPPNLTIDTPIETHLRVYAPVNYGTVKLLRKGPLKIKTISWKPPKRDYKPNWDIGNLALVWLKCMDDMLIKKSLIPDDSIEYLQKTTYEFVPVNTLKERKLVYNIKTMK